ncbi:hypothetical protein [Hephaestia mangrovi]|uniref:hypothetical protein n=1 Tax=Hephaestia mangrovi TaxID=2873268 RepID=UPI001CA75D3E|nr:hypothetical protein [Hephaestia mangrovi]MBY8829753.1 hypothetical protein [Hephaestia mangrovi]
MLLLAMLALAGCSSKQDAADVASGGAGARLEQAAIARGVIRDPASADLTGVYASDPERVCVVPGESDFRIGVTLDYGERQQCSAAGTLKRSGEGLKVDLGDGCAFDARFDGQGIRFPGALPDACSRQCTGRATMAGLSVDMLSNSLSEATALADAKGRALCAPDSG